MSTTPGIRERAAAVVQWFETSPAGRGATVLFIAFAVLYLATATYRPNHLDTTAAAFPAWNLVAHGTLRLDAYDIPNPFFRRTATGVFSDRFPGVIFIAVPAYVVADLLGFLDRSQATVVPATITAAVLTAAAIAVLYVVFNRVVPARAALVATVIAGVGTTTWSVSADSLWTHGPVQLFLALAMLGMSSNRYAGTGLACAAAVVTRPQTAIVPLVFGIWEGIRTRSLQPVVVIGLTSLIGFGTVIVYNNLIFGGPSIVGERTYATGFLTQMTPLSYFNNWAMTLISPKRGVLLYSPFVVLGLAGVRDAWRSTPSWARASAVSGLLYMALQLRVNVWDGGDSYFAYRLSLEMLTLAAPLLVVSIHQWLRSPLRYTVFRLTVVCAVALQLVGATVYLSLIEWGTA